MRYLFNEVKRLWPLLSLSDAGNGNPDREVVSVGTAFAVFQSVAIGRQKFNLQRWTPGLAFSGALLKLSSAL